MKKKTLTNVLFKLIVVLAIVLVSLISFLGMYRRNLNDWKNLLPEYRFSKELSEIRNFGFVVDKSTKEVEDTSDEDKDEAEVADKETEGEETAEDTTEDTEKKTKEVPVNDPSVLKKENYKKSKEIIEKRLKTFGIIDTTVTVNEENGELSVSVPHSKLTESAIALATSKGEIEIVDSDSKEVLISKKMIKNASAYYIPSDNSNKTYDLGVKLDFTSEGQKKLNEISKKYIETLNAEGEATQKTITVKIDGVDKYITYFSPEGNYTYIAVPLFQGVAIDNMDTFNDNYTDCLVAKTIINEESLPIVYELSTGTYIESDMGKTFLKAATICIGIILAFVAVLLICKFKKNGLMAAIIEIGYVAILLLIIRAASVSITLTGLVTILLVSLINELLLAMLMKKEKFAQFGTFILNMIPFIITILVFNFTDNINIQSVGMVGFWGILGYIYTLITSVLLFSNTDAKKNGKE